MKIDKVGLDLFGFDLNILPRKLKISAEKMINIFFFLHFCSEENYEKIVPKENRNHSSGAAAERSEATSIEHGRVAVYKTLRKVKHQLGRQHTTYPIPMHMLYMPDADGNSTSRHCSEAPEGSIADS